MVTNVLPMQSLVYHVNKLLWMFSSSKSNRDRQSQTYRQRCSDVGNPFYLLSVPLDRYRKSLKLWNRSVSSTKKHQHKPKACRHTSTTVRTPYLPRGRSCDPMTRVLFFKISCFLQRCPHSVSNSTTYWLPREWTGTETAWDGGLCPFSDLTPLSSPPLSHTLFTSFPFPLSFCLGMTERLGVGMRVVLLLLVCLNGSDPAESIKFTQEFKPASHKHRLRLLIAPFPLSSAHLRANSPTEIKPAIPRKTCLEHIQPLNQEKNY